MTQLISRGYEQASSTTESQEIFQLFSSNLTLILNHKQQILNCRGYFFVTVPSAYCSYPYIAGDGHLFLGYLLLGWEQNILTDTCSECQNTVLIINFGGSIFSGYNKWWGICRSCLNEQSGRWETFSPRWQFVSELRKSVTTSILVIRKRKLYLSIL